MSGSSPFEEGMKALGSGDSNGAIMHLQFADQTRMNKRNSTPYFFFINPDTISIL